MFAEWRVIETVVVTVSWGGANCQPP